jgi:hypothetical protein
MSELIAKHELNLSRPIDDAVTTPAWNSEILVARPSVNASKGVPIESIRYIGLEQNGLSLSNGRSFDNRKILIHVSRTSPPGDSRR